MSGPYVSWADRDRASYLYHDVSGNLIHPPSGMRSSVPLGGEVSSAHNKQLLHTLRPREISTRFSMERGAQQ